jgi:hypothetical protein
MEDVRDWHQGEIESLRQDLAVEMEKKDDEISRLHDEVAGLRTRRVEEKARTSVSTASSVVTRGLANIVSRKLNLFGLYYLMHLYPI